MSKIILRMKKKIDNSNENSKIIMFNILGSTLIRGLALLISLLTLPAYIRYFDSQEILGLWFTILSVLNWVLAFDLGIGNGLRNRLVPTFIKEDYLLSKKYISSAYGIIFIIVFISLVVSFFGFKLIDWNLIFNISINQVSKETLSWAVLIVFSGIMLQFLFKIINSILYALQKSALNNLLSLLTSLIIFIYVSFVDPGNLSFNLITLAIINVLAVNIPLVIATIIVFQKSLKKSKPNVKFFEIKYVKDVLVLGGVFFWVQIMYMILSVTNEFLISWFTVPANVVEYQIYFKLFTLMGTIFTLALAPVWSAITKAMVEENFVWINKLYRKLVFAAIIVSMFQFLMIPFLQPIINFWLRENTIEINYGYAFVFAVSGSLFIWIGVLSTISNGFGLLKIQSIFYTLGVIIKMPVAWYLVQIFDSWIGVIIANIIALSLFCIIQPIWIKKYIDSKIIGDENSV